MPECKILIMILITGGTGLVGRYLLLKLVKEGRVVRAIKRQTSNIESVQRLFYNSGLLQEDFDKIEWVEAEVNDIPLLEKIFDGVKQVYHCAAVVSFNSSDREKIYKVNIEGTANIVNLCLHYKVSKMCFVSSIAALGKPNGKYTTEENYWITNKDDSAYSVSKYLSEMEVWRAAQEGLDVVIVNPAIILGGGSISDSILQRIDKGMLFYTEGVNAFVDVRDVVQVMVLLMDREIFHKRYILAADNVSFKYLFVKIAEQMGRRVPKYKLTPFIGNVLCGFAFLWSKIFKGKPMITKSILNFGFNKSYYSNEKIRKELNYNFIPLDDTIEMITQDYMKK